MLLRKNHYKWIYNDVINGLPLILASLVWRRMLCLSFFRMRYWLRISLAFNWSFSTFTSLLFKMFRIFRVSADRFSIPPNSSSIKSSLPCISPLEISWFNWSKSCSASSVCCTDIFIKTSINSLLHEVQSLFISWMKLVESIETNPTHLFLVSLETVIW